MRKIINNKIKVFVKIQLVIVLLIFTNGCEDVIEVDLNSTAPAIVIEAAIKDNNSPSRVIITKSTDFYKPGIYEGVSGAIISVKDSKENIYDFNEISNGIYETTAIIGESGVKYSIEVVVEGETYKAVSTMPNHITLDSLAFEEAPSKPGDEGLGRLFLHIYFQDESGIDDYCRFKIYNNGAQLGGFNIYSDKLTDGNYVDYRLLLDTEENNIQLGDTITVELMSIDEAAYNFYKTANSVNASATGGKPASTSLAPANPVTNWNNKALGIFNAYTVSKRSIKVEG